MDEIMADELPGKIEEVRTAQRDATPRHRRVCAERAPLLAFRSSVCLFVRLFGRDDADRLRVTASVVCVLLRRVLLCFCSGWARCLVRGEGVHWVRAAR